MRGELGPYSRVEDPPPPRSLPAQQERIRLKEDAPEQELLSWAFKSGTHGKGLETLAPHLSTSHTGSPCRLRS